MKTQQEVYDLIKSVNFLRCQLQTYISIYHEMITRTQENGYKNDKGEWISEEFYFADALNLLKEKIDTTTVLYGDLVKNILIDKIQEGDILT